MNNIYNQLDLGDEFGLIYENDFPAEKKKEISRVDFCKLAKELTAGGLSKSNFCTMLVRSKFDIHSIKMVADACLAEGSKISMDSLDPALFAFHKPEVLSGLVYYISNKFQGSFVTGVLHQDQLKPIDGSGDYLSAVDDWIEKEYRMTEQIHEFWTDYFTAEKREGVNLPKVVVRDKNEYNSDSEYLADVFACLKGIAPMETFKGENIYAQAKALRFGGYPRLEKYLLRNYGRDGMQYNCKKELTDFMNGN